VAAAAGFQRSALAGAGRGFAPKSVEGCSIEGRRLAGAGIAPAILCLIGSVMAKVSI